MIAGRTTGVGKRSKSQRWRTKSPPIATFFPSAEKTISMMIPLGLLSHLSSMTADVSSACWLPMSKRNANAVQRICFIATARLVETVCGYSTLFWVRRQGVFCGREPLKIDSSRPLQKPCVFAVKFLTARVAKDTKKKVPFDPVYDKTSTQRRSAAERSAE